MIKRKTPAGRVAAKESGAGVRFAVRRCSLGEILVATTDKGVCAVLLGDSGMALEREFRVLFPGGSPAGGDAGFDALAARVVRFVDSPGCGDSLPMDPHGTPFQLRVWAALTAIPPGETIGYSALAEKIGAPKSARAVAGACAANAVAVLIPCHRVVRADGGLSGYRWGVERKLALLRRESAKGF